MNEEQQQDAATPTRWQRVSALVKHEAHWLAETLGMVTVTLALGRLMQKLGINVSHLTGTSWDELVKKWLQQEKKP